MKVGTDGTLLGAWTPVEQAQNGTILDVGTGSGLIALMLAQRCPEATILGIDADEAAAKQATDNFALSKWSDRLTAKHISLQQLAQDETCFASFDLIVSNPPYFVDSLKNPDHPRNGKRKPFGKNRTRGNDLKNIGRTIIFLSPKGLVGRRSHIFNS